MRLVGCIFFLVISNKTAFASGTGENTAGSSNMNTTDYAQQLASAIEGLVSSLTKVNM